MPYRKHDPYHNFKKRNGIVGVILLWLFALGAAGALIRWLLLALF